MENISIENVSYENREIILWFNKPVVGEKFSMGVLNGIVESNTVKFSFSDQSSINYYYSYSLLERNGEVLTIKNEKFKTRKIKIANNLLVIALSEDRNLSFELIPNKGNIWNFDAEIKTVELLDDVLNMEGIFNPLLLDTLIDTNREFKMKVFAEQNLLAEIFIDVDLSCQKWTAKLDIKLLESFLQTHINIYFWMEEKDNHHIHRAKIQKGRSAIEVVDKIVGHEMSAYEVRIQKNKYFTVNIKRQIVLLEKIQITQLNHIIKLSFKISENIREVKALKFIFPSDSKAICFLCEEVSDQRYEVKINYQILISTLVDGGREKGTFIVQIISSNNASMLMQIKTPKTKFRDSQSIVSYNQVPYEISMLARKIQGLVLRIRKAKVVRTIHFIQPKCNHQIRLKGASILRGLSSHKIKRYLIIRNRITMRDHQIPLPYLKDKAFSYVYRFDNEDYDYCGFDILVDINRFFIEAGIYDFYVVFDDEEFYIERKLGFSKYIYKKDHYLLEDTDTLSNSFDVLAKALFSITPGGNLKFEVLHHPVTIEPTLSLNTHEEVWLIGERHDTAQDTGYHFFKYCRESYPEKQVFYAIDASSKDYEKVECLGNVVTLNSSNHIYVSRHVTHIFGSHDLEYILPYKLSEMKNAKYIKKIFLQHGVMGRKSAEYHKYYYDYPFDLVITSSDYEKKMFVEHFKYKPKEISVTGLSRFDSLYINHNKKNIYDKKIILVMPTWREWLHDSKSFEESRYFKEYINLLRNERLENFLKDKNIELWFYPHYRMQPFLSFFNKEKKSHVKIIQLGTKSVQDLLIMSHLLITDYSSVSFDYSFMKKPVIFFHFDYKRFFRKGILRPVSDTFLGSIVYDVKSLIDQIIEYDANNYLEKEGVSMKRHLILKYVDNHNCERIISAVNELNLNGVGVKESLQFKFQNFISFIRVRLIRYVFSNIITLKAAVFLKKKLRVWKIIK